MKRSFLDHSAARVVDRVLDNKSVRVNFVYFDNQALNFKARNDGEQNFSFAFDQTALSVTADSFINRDGSAQIVHDA